MIRPTVYGQAIIILVYVPLLTFTGVEGKMFAPMAITVMLALVCAFVLSLTFVPAMVAILIRGNGSRRRRWRRSHLQARYAPALELGAGRRAVARDRRRRRGRLACAGRVALHDARDRSSCRSSTRSDMLVQALRIPRHVARPDPRRCSRRSRGRSRRCRRSQFVLLDAPARRRSRPIRCRPTSPTRSSS